LKVLGAVFPHFCPDKREIWHGGADRYRGNVSPLQGEKPIFGPLSKNNTGKASADNKSLAASSSVQYKIASTT